MAICHYLAIAEQLPENWSLSFPAFPGAVTTGQDFAELIANARDALASVVSAMQEDGDAVPPSFEACPDVPAFDLADYLEPRIVLVPVEVGGRSVRINVTMDEGLVARLDNLADRAHASRSALLARGARMVLAVEAAE
jgi:predicted RNase H-like HicB family nuclease